MVLLEAVHTIIDRLVQSLVLLTEGRFQLAVPRIDIGMLLLQHAVDFAVRVGMLLGDSLEFARMCGVGLEAVVHRRMVVRQGSVVVLLIRVHLAMQALDVRADLAQDLVDLPAPAIYLQPQGGGHVAHGLDRRIDIVVHVVPCSDVCLRVQLRLGLVAQDADVLTQLVAALMGLLETLRYILHPRVVRLQGLLHVAHVEPHRRDLGGDGRLHSLPRGDDGVGGVDAGAHLVQVDVHRVHGGGKVLHVALAGQHDAFHVGGVVLLPVDHVLELADVILDGVEIVRHAVRASSSPVNARHPARVAPQEGELLLEVRGHELQLAGDLSLEVADPVGHLLEQLAIAGPSAESTRTRSVLCAATAARKLGQDSRLKLLELVVQVGFRSSHLLTKRRLQVPGLRADDVRSVLLDIGEYL
mmetsp:Transcript_104522/g.300860  ORF Transcript_104522/g.300860 Transcript_104522/m.300860 type:complete len:413 (+) Transcript_104522:842-2080(+)